MPCSSMQFLPFSSCKFSISSRDKSQEVWTPGKKVATFVVQVQVPVPPALFSFFSRAEGRSKKKADRAYHSQVITLPQESLTPALVTPFISRRKLVRDKAAASHRSHHFWPEMARFQSILKSQDGPRPFTCRLSISGYPPLPTQSGVLHH